MPTVTEKTGSAPRVISKSTVPDIPDDRLTEVCIALQHRQRRRASFIKSRIVAENNRTHTVATLLGYHAGLEEDDRKKKFKEAEKLIKEVTDDHKELLKMQKKNPAATKSFESFKHPAATFIRAAEYGVVALEDEQSRLEDEEMRPLAKELPLVKWIDEPEQDGVSLLYLAVIIGETGDLRKYANPAKVWRRLGLAPWTYKDDTFMGSTWKAGVEGNLPASEWAAFGYSPRRRSISYLIGQNIKMQNKSIYRARYEREKERFAQNHPDYVKCKCAGTGKNERGGECKECLGKGRKMLRADRHGMLCAAKLFLKLAWKQWVHSTGFGHLDVGEWHERNRK